jgi:adenine/guanine phosphoribosyltransferase-like PRPP-binding protein
MPIVSRKRKPKKRNRNILCASYIEEVLDPNTRKGILAKVVKELKKIREKIPFDAIAFRGVSGSLVAIHAADKLGVSIIVCRKESEYNGSHSNYQVEGMKNCKYIIVDDFIDTGRTVSEMIELIDEQHRGTSSMVGFYGYDHWEDRYNAAGCAAQELGITLLNKILN